MKKILGIVLISLLTFSCSNNPNDRLVRSLKKEIKAEPVIKKFSNNEVSYKWENVSIIKDNAIKNVVDRELNMLPTKTEDMEPVFDEYANIVPNEMQKYYVYESPKFRIELDYTYLGSDKLTIDLRIVDK